MRLSKPFGFWPLTCLVFATAAQAQPLPREAQEDPPAQPATEESAVVPVVRGRFTSIQVNVNAAGNNIVNDAANEPSLAVDPTNPNKIAIGWRQFYNVNSNFRQAGWAYTQNGGQTWTFPGVLAPIFRSDPILESDADGVFYYNSLKISPTYICDVFRSVDGGMTWQGPFFAFGGDKAWMTVDRTGGMGRGNIYHIWNPYFGCCGPGSFNRSSDGGMTFSNPVVPPNNLRWGTVSVGPDGEVYVVGTSNFTEEITVIRSPDAQNSALTPTFDTMSVVDLGGYQSFGGGPNPGGLLGQHWIATDHSSGPTRGNVYVLSSIQPFSSDPLDIMFARSIDGGQTWSTPVRVNDDPPGTNAWQWFGTMDVAPNGRIDVIWNDTRNTGLQQLSELYYSYSTDAGTTWSPNVPVSPVFNSWIGWPNQAKIGDYYDMLSDNTGAHVAYAATFTGGQDVYYLRIGLDCNGNNVSDDQDLAGGTSADCNGNGIPDECDIAEGTSENCNGNAVPDECEVDTDGDGVIDDCDNCPAISNANQADQDFDGKGNVCDPCPRDFYDDLDGDGVCNSDELCPFDPGKLEPGQCGCDVPDTDSDGDGAADCVDQCPGVDDAVYAPGCVGEIPTVSTWGLVILGLLLLTGAKVYFRRAMA